MIVSILRRPRILLAGALVFLVALVTFHNRDALSDSLPTRPRLDPEAHKLPRPDSFRAHFLAVTRLPGITMAEAKATCHWPKGEYVDFQFGANTEWVVTDRPDEEIEARRTAWQQYVEGRAGTGMIPWRKVKDRFKGRGLVILAGNNDTIMRLKVILRRLVRLRSQIPVEVHYFSDEEMTEEKRKDLVDIGYHPISFNDLSQPHNLIRVEKDFFATNFHLKSAAIINSNFAEPFLLDSDNVPILDPAILYASPVYQEYGTVFWPDIARSWPQNPAWAITNTPCRMNEYEQESGQMMVDKRRYWYHLQLAAWMNHPDSGQGKYYNEFLLGDKDMFRFAWHALKTKYGRPHKWLTSVGTLNDGFYCGHSFAQHHPDAGDGRVAFLHGGLVKSVTREVMRWNKEERGGYFRHYKRAPSDEDPAENVHVEIIWDGADYKPKHQADFRAAMCTDMRDVKVGNLNEIIPGWEREYEALGGYWMLDLNSKGNAVKAKDKTAGKAPVAV